MTINLFTAYFRRDNHSNGQSSFVIPDDGAYPQYVVWEENIYQLWDTNERAREVIYEYFGPAQHETPDS